jgi:ATP adenylyltransferase
MKMLWAPWRIEYIRAKKAAGCILCDKPKESDDAGNYILYRGKKNFVILNLYPYNPGHLMVAPYRHLGNLDDFTDEELREHFEIVRRFVTITRATFEPAGFNMGINVGKVAGAGVEGHVHTHIVPRWQGDTNFMPVIGDMRVVSEGLAQTYQRLKEKL